MSKPLETYALIGDRHTAALVAQDGSIDWLCLPRFDSQACFAAILGDDSHGHWRLGPAKDAQVSRRYLDDTMVLETTYTTATGRATLTDFMPTGEERDDLVRILECTEGSVEFEHDLVIRFRYGKTKPWMQSRTERASGHEHETLRAIAGPDSLVLRGTRIPVPDDDESHYSDRFTLEAGERAVFDLVWSPSYQPIPEPLDELEALEATVAESRKWMEGLQYDGPHVDKVRRSVLVLRALTHEASGGIIAAPTTSLPEDLGGSRNWDYRFTWLRDAALTVEALVQAGFADKSEAWRDWLVRAAAGDVEHLLVVYELDGGRDLVERELDHLPGYENSRPVRIGNGAKEQHQNDVLGEVMIAFEQLRESGAYGDISTWNLQQAMLDRFVDTWMEPDHGIWEMRGPTQRFTHSRAMVWAAFDRGVRAAEQHDLPGDIEQWAQSRDEAREWVLSVGYNDELGYFTQHDETSEVDASLLQLAAIGIIEPDDPRFVRTVEQIEADLLRDGFLLRYRTSANSDGLEGDEHPFLICCFWLVIAYVQIGRREDAIELMDRLLGTANDVGLMAEEYSPELGRLVGNYPQAFSHLGLVQAAMALAGGETIKP